MHTTDAFLGYFGLLFVFLTGVVVFGISGLAYFLLFPELKTVDTKIQRNVFQSPEKSVAIESVRRTLTVDERKILEVLENHKGKYLQKYLRKEAGLSRLKTHRIIVRFSERGLVTLEKVGNTNEVRLVDWLRKT
ncbi:MAG: helix-turn-helix transcriptional regulator [Promethearchaeota archaeon]